MANVEEVAQRVLKGVLEESTLEPQELDMLTGAAGQVGAAYQRFGTGDVTWVVRQLVPGRQDLVVFAIFAGDIENDDDNNAGDVRIYCIPIVDNAPFVRYTMSRLNPTLLGLALDYKRFVEELTEEWEALAVRFGISDGEDDSVACPACGVLTETRLEKEEGKDDEDDAEDPEPVFCGGCGLRLPPPATEPTQTVDP